MRRFLLPNNTVITEKSLRDLYSKVRSLISKRDNRDALSIMEETLSAIDRFFSGLGKPQFEYKEIYPEDPVIAEEINDLISGLIADLELGYQEVENLREATISVHNYSSIHVSELKRRADEIAGLVTDLRLLADQQSEEVIVFSDNFVDNSKLDPSFPLEYPEAQTMPGQGSLTLFRIENNTINSNVDIVVTPLGSVSRNPTPDNTERFYEGHFYSYLGDAEPEGGIFHLEEKINSASLAGLNQAAFDVPEEGIDADRKEKKNFVVPGGFEAKFLEQVKAGLFNDKFKGNGKGLKKFIRERRAQLHKKDAILRRQYLYYASNPEAAQQAGVDLSNEVPLTPENVFVVDIGASEQELQNQRQKMLDGNPASYWQCELVKNTNVLQDYVEERLDQESSSNVSAAELRELAQSNAVDKTDLEVELVFTLDQPSTLNYITINPMTFDDGAFLEVTDLSTAGSDSEEFVPVESFVSGEFSNVLTDEANKELSDSVANFVLAPSRFSYRGIGVWPFAARVVNKIRIRLKQRTPVPNPYEKLVFEAERTLITKRNKKI